jgi:hypothetical protein
MTDRQKLALHEERLAIYARDHGICQHCHKSVPIDAFEVAHRIANTKSNLKRFGVFVIDSPHNKATTHRGACNSGMNCGFRPDACAKIVALCCNEGAKNEF